MVGGKHGLLTRSLAWLGVVPGEIDGVVGLLATLCVC